MRTAIALLCLMVAACDQLQPGLRGQSAQFVCRANRGDGSEVATEVIATIEVSYDILGFDGRPLRRTMFAYDNGGVVYCDRVIDSEGSEL